MGRWLGANDEHILRSVRNELQRQRFIGPQPGGAGGLASVSLLAPHRPTKGMLVRASREAKIPCGITPPICETHH